jgi:hypothetical protein
MTEQQGLFTIPTRLYLTHDQCMQLEHIVRERGGELSDLLSQIISEYLEGMPPAPPSTPASRAERETEVRQRKAELARLYARRDAAGSAAPAWLHTYISDLEMELERLRI